MHNTLVFATFPLHSSVFYHSTERFVKFGAVLHHDLCIEQGKKARRKEGGERKQEGKKKGRKEERRNVG